MTNEDVRDIFIEEATDIIEKLNIDIINFEEYPEDKNLLNELFRGVHTLKGSANSFGFTRLGEFVHHFEDVLDHYRNSDDVVSKDGIDLFLDAVDVIKEVLWIEIEGSEGLPEKYTQTLDGIKKILDKEGTQSAVEEDVVDLASEFEDMDEFEFSEEKHTHFVKDDLDRIKASLRDEEELYFIDLKLDTDIYFRGFDYSIIFKMLD